MIIPSGLTNAGTYWYHYDGLGSVVALSDSTGAIVEKYTYTPFGKTTIHSPGLNGIWGDGDDDSTLTASDYDNPYMFTGRRYDDETGLYYYRARMYNPEIGRFLQPDPIGYADGMNMYAYVGNNPLNWIDPFGLEKVKTLTREEFEIAMEPMIKEILKKPNGFFSGFSTRINPYTYITGIDSGYHDGGDPSRNRSYNYMGFVATGNNLNYYLQGILNKHLNYHESVNIIFPFSWNAFANWNIVDWNEMVFTQFGYEEYEYWVEKLKSEP
jgi:RHS repeat-associated protein